MSRFMALVPIAVALLAGCSKPKSDASKTNTTAADAERQAAVAKARTDVDAFTRRVRAVNAAVAAANKPPKCTKTTRVDKALLIDRELLERLAADTSSKPMPDRDERIDDFAALSSKPFAEIVGLRRFEASVARSKQAGTYDSIHGKLDGDQQISERAAKTNPAGSIQHVVVIDANKELPKVSTGSAIGFYTPGKMKGRALVVDGNNAVVCATSFTSTNSEGIERKGLSSIYTDYFARAREAVRKSLGVADDALVE